MLLSVIMLVAVLFESAALAVMVTFGMMIMSPVLAQTKLMEKLLSSPWTRNLWKALYYVLPKVYDMGSMTLNTVRGKGVRRLAPVWSSALFAVVMLGRDALHFFEEGLLMRPAAGAFVCWRCSGRMRPSDPPSVEIDPALARLVPGDTTALIGVKVDALRATPLYGKWVAPRLDNLAKEKTLGPNKDVSELLVVSNGKNTVVFAKGKSSVFQLGSDVPPPPSKDGLPASLREKMRSIPPQSQMWAAGLGSLEIVNDAIPKEGNLANLRNVLSTDRKLVGRRGPALRIEDGSARRLSHRSGRQAHPRRPARTAGPGASEHPDDAPELLRFYDGIQVTQQTELRPGHRGHSPRTCSTSSWRGLANACARTRKAHAVGLRYHSDL